jgi:hypothetical protein
MLGGFTRTTEFGGLDRDEIVDQMDRAQIVSGVPGDQTRIVQPGMADIEIDLAMPRLGRQRSGKRLAEDPD